MAEPVSDSDLPPTTPEAADAGLRPCAAHPGVQTRLSCSHCETPICPKCMVVCEVGMKCKKCTSKSASHVVKAEPRDYALAGLFSIALGAAYGYALPMLTGYSMYLLILCFFMGQWGGQAVHRFARYKLAGSLMWVMLAGAAIGIFALRFDMISELVNPSPASQYYNPAVMHLIGTGLFLGGISKNFYSFRR